jgi:voltage-gated potassium channel
MKEPDFKHFHKIRTKLFIVVFGTDTPAGRLFDIVLSWAIVLSIITVMLESVREIKAQLETLFNVLEWTFTVFFTIEYMLRISITKKPRTYILSYYGIIDFLALLPTYITIFVSGGSYLVVIRAIRLLRIFRILKLTRYIQEAQVLGDALKASSRKILVFIGAVFTLVLITGTLMYLIEGGENGFTSIPRSIYWAVVTVTTVGYGDIAPGTVLGQAFATVLMLTGYAIIAVPTGIMTSEINKAAKEEQRVERLLNMKSCSRCDTPNLKEANYCIKCGEKFVNN